MPFITAIEIFEILILIVVLGYVFSGYIPKQRKIDDFSSKFSWDDLWFAAIVAAPAVIIHEFGHKFLAMSFGLEATFSIWILGLVIAIVLRMLNSPFLFLAPAYVSIIGSATSGESALVAFAGPLMNLVLWGISAIMIKRKNHKSLKAIIGWSISKKLNLFLFFFNLIPIPPLDGYTVLTNLIALFSS